MLRLLPICPQLSTTLGTMRLGVRREGNTITVPNGPCRCGSLSVFGPIRVDEGVGSSLVGVIYPTPEHPIADAPRAVRVARGARKTIMS